MGWVGVRETALVAGNSEESEGKKIVEQATPCHPLSLEEDSTRRWI